MAEQVEEQFDKICFEFVTTVTKDQYKEKLLLFAVEPTVGDDPQDSSKICVAASSLECMKAIKELYSQVVQGVRSHLVKVAYEGGDLEELEKALETDLRGNGVEFVARLVSETEIRVISYWENQDHDITVVQNFVEDFKLRYPVLQPVKFALNSRINLLIIKGDLTKVKCDAIVSPSCPDLSNKIGISKEISKLCGLEFQASCHRHIRIHGVKSTGDIHRQPAEGQILCNGVKYVIHAITPGVDEPDAVKKVESVICEALSEANMLGCNSVALPAISADYPSPFKETCIEAFWNAVQNFVKTRPRLREIYLVCHDKETVLMIQQALQKYTPVSTLQKVHCGTVSTSALTSLKRAQLLELIAPAVDSNKFDKIECNKICYEFMTIVTKDQYKKEVLDVVKENGGELRVTEDPKTSSNVRVQVTGIKTNVWLMIWTFKKFYNRIAVETQRYIMKNTYTGAHLEKLSKALEQDLRGRSIEFVARLVTRSYIHVICYLKNLDHDITVVEEFVDSFKEKHPTGPLPPRVRVLPRTPGSVPLLEVSRGFSGLTVSSSSPDLYNTIIQPCLDRSNTVDSSSSGLSSTVSSSCPDLSIKVISPLQKLLSLDEGKQNDLHRAIDTKSSASVTQLLKSLASDEEREQALGVENGRGCTALRTAAYYGDVKSVESILNSVGPSWRLKVAKCRNRHGHTAAHKAVEKGNAAVLECILNHLEENERYHLLKMPLHQDGMTVLHIAVDRNYVEVIRCLRNIVNRIDWLELLKIQMNIGYNVLHKLVATRLNNTDKVIKELLADIDMEKKFALLQQLCENTKDTVIQLAIDCENYLGIRETLTSLPSDKQTLLLSSRNCSSSTVMHVAAIHNNVKFFEDVEKELDVQQDVATLLNMSNEQNLTPLHHAVGHNCLDIVKKFVKYLNPKQIYSQLLTKDKAGSTALHLAAKKGGRTMQYLMSLKDGEKYISEEIDRNGDTILHILSYNSDMTTINHCLKAMPDELRSELLRLANHNGKTAYALAPSAKIRELLAWSAEQEGFYYLPTPPVVLVMYSTIDRDGAHEEQETVVGALPPFGLKPIVEPDLTRQEMLNKIKAALTQEDISGLILFIMGHGKQGAVFAKDGEVKIQDIIDTMCDPVLKNKPKVLMVQACQLSDGIAVPEETEEALQTVIASEESPYAVPHSDLKESQTDVGPPSSQYSVSDFKLREDDVVTMLATISGGKAKRNTMIPVFAEQLLLNKKSDIYEIFLKTQKAVKALTPGQVLEYRATLCQKLCLDNVFKPNL